MPEHRPPAAAVDDVLADLVVCWQATHGRHDLPWQNTRDPYRVWLSEIMLQQTQVATVLGYYDRFLQRFPDVASLAAGSADDVMALWSGLGYYSRARNLHRCAHLVVEHFGGVFPPTAALLETLPGIGRSTAAAIASFCYGERVAILDANVKRVLTRVLGFAGDLAQAVNERALWLRATDVLPRHPDAATMPRYTQGLMDLGATVCLPRMPSCLICPLQTHCVAYLQGNVQSYPVKRRAPKRSAETWWLYIALDRQGRIRMERRPTPGIWAGLYCPPVFRDLAALRAEFSRSEALIELPVSSHALTHKDLTLRPVLVPHDAISNQIPGDGAKDEWRTASQWAAAGLPAPIRNLLLALDAGIAAMR